MRIYGKNIGLSKLFYLFLYYGFARFLPSNKVGKWFRFHVCRHIFKFCGDEANIERMAFFGSGVDIYLGRRSGVGKNCNIPSDTFIGDNVMMGPNCIILSRNHCFEKTDVPMIDQGFSSKKQTIIENDVWIGRDVLMTPGRHIKMGSIIAAGCVLCKDFPEYSIIGGNPSKLIRNRRKN